MPQFEVSIPYTGIQTRIVLADSPEEALEKAKNGDLFPSWEAGTVPWNDHLRGHTVELVSS